MVTSEALTWTASATVYPASRITADASPDLDRRVTPAIAICRVAGSG